MTPLVALVAGLFVWSLAEYLVHRFVLHGVCPRFHVIHHHDPLDGNGVPYILAVPAGLAGILVGLHFWAWPGAAFGLGLFAGYLAYVTVHEGMHHHPDWLPANNRRHDEHHRFWRCNYGVTTPLWDWVFGTLRKP